MTPLPPHRAYALGAFRWSVFFIFAAAAFSERDDHTRSILVTGVFLLDVVSWHLCELVIYVGNGVYNRVWIDTLTHRFFYEKLLDAVKFKQEIHVQDIIKESTAAAREDAGNYLTTETFWYSWGGFRKTLLGIGHFLWWWLSYGIFYGIAGALGQSLRSY